MRAEVITITPDMAQNFLSTNKNNRPLDRKRVAFYGEQMKNGNWLLNGEAIKFDYNGNLLDGQHRLSAIIEVKKGIQSLVVKGLVPETFKTLDSGKIRTASDILSIRNVTSSTTIAGGIAKYLFIIKGYVNIETSAVTAKTSNSDILAEYEANSELYNYLQLKAAAFYRNNCRVLTTSEYVAFYRVFQTKHSDAIIESFFNAVDRNAPCEVLFNKLLKNITDKRKMVGSEKSAVIIKAFNAFVENRPIKMLKYSIEEKFPAVK